MPEVVSIYIAAESEAALVTRLVGRATEPVDKLLTRVQTARKVRGLPACKLWLAAYRYLTHKGSCESQRWACLPRCPLRIHACCCKLAPPLLQTSRPRCPQETARMGEFDYVVVNRAGRLEETAAAISGIIDAEMRRVPKSMKR